MFFVRCYFHVLSSPRGAGTIFLPFYRRRAAREQYFRVSVLAALLRALKFLFSPFRNGDVCWRMVGAVPVCPPKRPLSGVSIPKIHALCAGNLTMDAPLQGDSGEHTGTAPTKLHHTHLHHSIKRHHPSTCNPPIINSHFGRVSAKPSII